MDIDTLIDAVIDREGGYTDHPADRGGATRYGITQRVARAEGYHGPMRHLPRAVAESIYRRLYWTRPRLDRIAERAPALAAELFDTGVNMGPSVAIGFLQRALNALDRDGTLLLPDGQVGPRTLAALDAFLAQRPTLGETVLTRACDALQGERYVALTEQRPLNKAFLYGWLANRIGSTD
ncbi:glycosyl hydrolase 108 family protein [Sphingomonas sp. BGYR3]|uniref:glycoside hydrolase family 108 protein n=1 Tax=Sphingomonas sp. BGYR3 TaxID=2975483 RepID=UPI0021A5CD88|nr:N-acetylmuramidase [Sphingomonas sp. BGYR3]MDG5489029.1 glycosyl hydrolase 108 family protein [Sphingomonas sp. BGYR3]